MWKDIPDFSQQLVKTTLDKYAKLAKTGKPLLHVNKAEWTVLASILLVYYVSKDDYSIQVVSMGKNSSMNKEEYERSKEGLFQQKKWLMIVFNICRTGLKCLPCSKLCKSGQVVHDCHAEVIARRGFIKYCIDQMSVQDGPFTAINNNHQQWQLKPNYSFHMYISQSPCGDASMTVLAESQSTASFEAFQAGIKRKKETDSRLIENAYGNKKQKLDNSNEIAGRGRFGFDQLGILRTKPGRVDAEPTLSMSCSDKLARWNVLGLQSALLANVFDPIYLESITIGDMFDQEALERALYQRVETIKDLPSPYSLHQPIIYSTDIHFESSKTVLESTEKYTAVISCSTSICWVSGMDKQEVIVHGRKQGAPKGKTSNPKTRPSICKKSLLAKFLNSTKESSEKTLFELKKEATVYQQAKHCLLDQLFQSWVQTPSDKEKFQTFFVLTAKPPSLALSPFSTFIRKK
ncbi:hypothetical protein K501DRAFT_330629 [Backusella circina FSU 941]|nr:hypothetical protein K501DRAFT_330629 [Backusella circina FSU 941]